MRLDLTRIPKGIADSKTLSAKRRAQLYDEIMAVAEVCVAHATVDEILSLNILRAAHLAMQRAIAGIASVEHALIDGNLLPRGLACPSTAIIQGDARQPWTIYLAIPFERSGVQVSPGAEIQRFAVRDDALVADLDLGNGLVMLRARIPCASLTLGTTEPTAVSTPDTRQAHRHARALTLSVRARPEQGIEAVRLRVTRTLVWQELGRREPFVHVRATLPYGSVDAWAYDTDFVE